MTVESLSHDIDLLRWIMADEVAAVSGATFSTATDLEGFDNNAHVLLRLQSGASAVINASWSSRIGFNSRGVLGTRGTAFVSGSALGNNGIWCSREFHRKTDDDEFEFVEMLQDDLDDQSYRRQTDDFIESIATGRTRTRPPWQMATRRYKSPTLSCSPPEPAKRYDWRDARRAGRSARVLTGPHIGVIMKAVPRYTGE